jgi:restriction system protein
MMNLHDAVIQVLKEAGEPLHADDITKRVIAKGLWNTSGKTPAATVSAKLYSDIKQNGEASPFIQTAPQTFGLNPSKLPKINKPSEKPLEGNSQPKQTTSKTISFTDAAVKVLESFGQKLPMHYRAITDKALEMRLLKTEGKTPEATMYAQILTEIKRDQLRGDQPRFTKHGKGLVGLSRWTKRGLISEITQHNKKVREALHKQLLEMKWTEFEELIAGLLAEIGFEDIEVRSQGGDGGIDVRGTLVVGGVIRTQMAIQAKRWKHNVQSPIVQQVRGSLGAHEHGLIITTSDFSTGAREEANRHAATPVALMNGEQLVMLLVEYGIGVSRQSYELFELEGVNALN